ncbi:Na(+)-translocating NADH-quinone reductase subunit C [Novipirellula caenicola]|uniref:Na(+)-translocating NADH-quinone reductase subunit C n=1 Tax=Novipirellula caenicola TaxID=1536901 RepID=A0ABP9VNI3_9BACT
MQQRDSVFYTVGVAAVLCVVCSLAVSFAAVQLRPLQEENKKLDRQRNILDAAGLSMGEFGKPASELSRKQVADLYSRVSEKLVDLETGQYNTELDIEQYDPREAIDKDDESVRIENPKYDLGEQRREKVARVYFVRKPGEEKIRQVVLPVYGKGLWSTLYGYLALKSDLQTIQGLTFYEHGETPGLGGEVDNPSWKAQWPGQKLFDENGEPKAEVYKGPAPDGNPYAVDGLSGATITSRGVTNLIRYWASDEGYGPFLEQLEKEIAAQEGETVTPAVEQPEAKKPVVAKPEPKKPEPKKSEPKKPEPKKPEPKKEVVEVEEPKAEEPKADEAEMKDEPKQEEAAAEEAKPKADEKPAAEEKPQAEDKPDAEAKPEAEDKPAAEDKPEVEEKAKAEDAPKAEDKPAAEEKPEVSEETSPEPSDGEPKQGDE